MNRLVYSEEFPYVYVNVGYQFILVEIGVSVVLVKHGFFNRSFPVQVVAAVVVGDFDGVEVGFHFFQELACPDYTDLFLYPFLV
ncbi:MAG: hypothetical protein ACI3Z7_01455 [Candidatus Aphodosoma sp.]